MCEAYNKTIKVYFNSKPTIVKLIKILSIEEDILFKRYSIIAKVWFISKRRIIGPNDYISCLPYFIDIEKELNSQLLLIRIKD